MPTHQVITANLNLRQTPDASVSNIIAILRNGQLIDVLEQVDSTWWNIQATLPDGRTLTGYVAQRYLQALTPPALERVPSEAHFPSNTGAKRVVANRYYMRFPLSEPDLPLVDKSTAEATIRSIHRIVTYLQPGNAGHLRYVKQPRPAPHNGNYTFCNIYACDFCKIYGAYLPRIWWIPTALQRQLQGEELEPIYEITVGEMNANALYEWLVEWGATFGWIRVTTYTALQEVVNQGHLGLISSKHAQPKFSGHIAVVVPEPGLASASSIRGYPGLPLLSQAGGVNFNYRYNERWWEREPQKYTLTGFWYHK